MNEKVKNQAQNTAQPAIAVGKTAPTSQGSATPSATQQDTAPSSKPQQPAHAQSANTVAASATAPKPSPVSATAQATGQNAPEKAVKQEEQDKQKKVKKIPAVLYLSRFQFEYLTQEMHQTLKMQFPQEIVRDLEVVNIQGLKDTVKAFIQQHQLQPADITILLADEILFTKALTLPDPKAASDEVKKFVDTVPFEDAVSITVPASATAITVAVANGHYYEAFKKAFEEQDFTVTLVLPAFVLAKDINLAKTVDVQSLHTAHKKSIEYQQYAFISEAQLAEDKAAEPSLMTFTTDNKKTDKKRFFLMVGVLILLLGVLVLVFTTMYQPVQKVPAVTAVPTPLPASPEVTTPAPVESIPVASGGANRIQSIGTIRIQHSPQGAANAIALGGRLRELGATIVEVVPLQAGGSPALRTIVSSAIPQVEKELIKQEIVVIEPEMTFIENTAAAVDVLITLTK